MANDRNLAAESIQDYINHGGTIPAETWTRYAVLQSKIQRKAADMMEAYMKQHGFSNRSKAIDYAFALTTRYGEAAAALACEMYDLAASMAGVNLPSAEPAETPSIKYVSSAVNDTAKRSEAEIPDTVGKMVKRTGADTTLQNAARDGAEWAWVPQGDTCAFCRMLASRGWQRQSKKAQAHHAEHIHNHCDCQYAVRFNGKGGPAGYDPEQYLKEYENAEGDNWKDKMNAMRRADYVENKEEINEQKRTAYAARQEREANQKQTEKPRSEKTERKPTALTGSAQSDIIGLDKAIGQQVNGTTIQWLSSHLQDQMKTRHVSAESVLNAITNPLEIQQVKTDDQGRRSFQVIGEKATFALDPDTGVLTTAWPTHSKLAARLKGGKQL